MIRINSLDAMQFLDSHRVALSLLAIPLLAYTWVLHQWGQNVPFNDDIPDILGFLLNYLDATSTNDKWQAILAPHNDHRTSASRLVYLFVFSLTGEVDFRTLMFVANGSVLILLGLLASCCRDHAGRWLLVMSLALLLFQPRAFGPMFFVMSGFAFFMVNVYGLASLKLLERPTPSSFAAALLLATLATYSLASGQLIWPAGLAWLVYLELRQSARNWHYPLLWLIAGILVLAAYQAGWDKPNTAAGLLGLLTDSPLFIARFAFAIMGSAVAWDIAPLAELSGLLVLSLLVWLTWRDFKRGLSPLHLFAWYVAGQCVVIAMGRAPYAAAMENSMFFALVPRYSFISLCLICPILLLALRGTTAPRPQLAVLVCSLAFNIASYAWYLPQVQAHWEHRLGFYNQGQFRLLGMPLKESNALVSRAVAAGIYHPPTPPLQAGEPGNSGR